ncbi:uncharacterized protein LOC122932489 [Bufo gargarizans]|uniref:uncharacterized protein LOC122932489 n=1 Tax=Bufo gargarizans TaxID=30331 RepID=UPI001CF2EFCC|nr:uncharacterized protein LOC122932489 [Bufo gargarizans]
MSPPDICAFCKVSEENEITGEMQRTRNGKIVAHYNCMLYSPRVLSIESEEDEEEFKFKIESVQSEIKRGKKLRCNICKKSIATAGCDVSSCRRRYHYPCVQKADGSSDPNRYVVYCKDHKSKNTANGSKDTDGKPKKRTSRSSANQPVIWEDCPEVGDGFKQRKVIRTSGKFIGHEDIYYMSPKGETFRSKKELQRHMDKSMDPSSSKSKDRKTQSPAEKGEGMQTRRRISPPRTALKDSRKSKTLIHQNNGTRAGDAVIGRTDVNVTDEATGSNTSEIEKTPETEPRLYVRVNLQRLPAGEHYTSEPPASPQGAPSTQLNAVPQISSQQYEDSRRCSLSSDKAVSKRKHRTSGNCSEPLPDDYEGILCRDCLQEESVKTVETQQNSCLDQCPINTGSIQKLTDQGKSHDVPPRKRPYTLQDQDVTDLPASIDSLDDLQEEGEGNGGNSDDIFGWHGIDTPSAGNTYSPQATPDQTSEPATSSMVPINAQAGTCNCNDVDTAPGPNNNSQVLQNLNRSAHVDPEESFLQSLVPYLHKIPITCRLKVKGAIIAMLQAAMSQNDSQSIFHAINLWQLKNEGPADVGAP